MARDPAISTELWDQVHQRDRVCQAAAFNFHSLTACYGPLRVHHRKLRSQGGGPDPSLLVLLCDQHHREVHDNPRRARECGLIVPSWG